MIIEEIAFDIIERFAARVIRGTYAILEKIFRPLFPARSPSQMDDGEFGAWAENQAARFLRKNGMTVLHRNYRTNMGELDVVARDKKTIVFIEVKAIRDMNGEPQLKVNADKRRRLITAAKAYITRHRLHDRPARFDIVTVQCDKEGQPIIRHEEDAFHAQ